QDPLRRFSAGLTAEMAARYLPLVAHFSPRDKEALLTAAFRAGARAPGAPDPALALFRAVLADSDATDDVNRLLELDTRTYLPDDILVKVDIASMAHALEVRCPLLDREVMAFAASLATAHKMRGLRTKVLLRAVARKLLPRAIITRRKRGFGL